MIKPTDTRLALSEIARDFHARGWMAGTAGNLSAKDDVASFWITASGRPKGRLEQNDFLLVRTEDGEIIERASSYDKPSAETAIHRAIYQCFPEAQACLHVHTISACIACEHVPAGATELPLPGLEMLKGLGIWEQHPQVTLPVFDNLLDVTRIAEAIAGRFKAHPPQVPALMIRGHGVTVWANSLPTVYDKVEIVEFLMDYIARRRSY